MQWTNPKADLVIASIDVIAGEERWGSSALFAITPATVVR